MTPPSSNSMGSFGLFRTQHQLNQIESVVFGIHLHLFKSLCDASVLLVEQSFFHSAFLLNSARHTSDGWSVCAQACARVYLWMYASVYSFPGWQTYISL